MRYLNLIIAAIFILFAYWQLNDDDWPQWVLMYGFVAATALTYHFVTPSGRDRQVDKSPVSKFASPLKWLPWIGLTAAGIWLATLVPDFINWLNMGAPTITGQMKAESPHVELTREFLGLLIVIIALGGYAWKLR